MNGGSVDVSNKVRVSLAIPSTSKAASQTNLTRDERIDYINLYVYENTSGLPDDYALSYVASSADVTYDAAKEEFSTTIYLNRSTKPTKILIVANQQGRMSNVLTSVAGKVNLLSPDDSDNTLIGTDNIAIPSSAEVEMPNGIDGNTDLGTIKLLRTMARVDVNKFASLSDDVFQLAGVSVWFSPNRSLMATEYLQSNDIVSRVTMPDNYSVLPLNFNNESVATSPIRWECNPLSDNKTTPSISNKIYIYENEDFLTFPDALETKSSRVIIWGYYNNNSYLSYYPVDFTASDNTTPMAVLRNHNFRISIKDVLTEGHTTEREAALGGGDGIITEIIEWVKNDQEIIFDGSSNWFSLQTKEVNIGGEYGEGIALDCGSNLDPKNWLMGWSDTEDQPESYATGRNISYTDEDGDKVDATKPLVPEQDGEFRGQLDIKTKTDNIKTKYLFLKPHGNLMTRIKVNIFPAGYVIPDWENEGDYNDDETTIG